MTARVLLLSVALTAQFTCGAQALAERIGPDEWLNRMAAAVQQTSYEGTVIRIRDGKAEALKVAHTVADGVIRERVVAQEGDGLEIIRIGNEVHCILPDRKSVLVEEWDDQSTLFSTLPSSEVRFGGEYDVAVVREERVAGRPAMLVAIRPHDEFRYGHRVWLDLETAFPLQTQLIGVDGVTVEQVKFADISLNKPIDLALLAPSVDTASFRWFNQPTRHKSQAIQTDWYATALPRGFRAIATHGEKMPGLANVSVFIADSNGSDGAGAQRVGGSNSFSTVIGEHRITAVGEVPAITLEQIATTMTLR